MAAVTSLRQLLRPNIADLHVEMRSVPARTVAAISSDVRWHEVQPWYDNAMAELDAAFPPPNASGLPEVATPTSCSPRAPGS
jgi:hypothetical protein